jgi:diketogulonate reductase-like aldo/keto reductase
MDIDIETKRTQMTKILHFTLNNGVKIPALGLGVLGRETPELVVPAVEKAIATGYRLLWQ